MSTPPIRITENRSYVTFRSAQVNAQPPSPRYLPSVPLVTFDLQIDNLKDYLNSVSNVVNQHGQLLKRIVEELSGRVSVTDMIQVLGAVGASVPDQLGQIAPLRSGDAWRDQVSFALSKLNILGSTVKDLSYFKQKTNRELTQVNQSLEQRPIRKQINEKFRKSKQKILLSVQNTKQKVEHEMKALQTRNTVSIQEMQKRFSELQQNTLWRLKDIQELLKHRVNEKFVQDAIMHLEQRLKTTLTNLNDLGISRYLKELKTLSKQIEKVQEETLGKFGMVQEQMSDVQSQLNIKPDNDDLVPITDDIISIRSTLSQMNFSQVKSDLSQVYSRCNSVQLTLQNFIQTIHSSDYGSQIQALRNILQAIRSQLQTKVDLDSAKQIHQKIRELAQQSSNSQFWIFRDQTIDHLQMLQQKLDKLLRSNELTILKKIVKTKANNQQVKDQLDNHDQKIIILQKYVSQHIKDIDVLSSLLKKLQALIQEMAAKSGLALIGRKSIPNCLSCGRGDANYAPIMPHVHGFDGKLYRGDSALTKGPVLLLNEFQPSEPDIFAQVVQRKEEPPKARRVTGPLNVLLGREVPKSASTLPSTNPRFRPQSAKKQGLK